MKTNSRFRQPTIRLGVESLEDRSLPSFGFGWAFSFGGPSSPGTQGNDGGKSIAVDTQGNVYVAGWLSSENVNFNPNGPPVVLPGGNFELYAAKYRPDTTLEWVADLGPGIDAHLAVQASNVYVAYTAGNQATAGPYNGTAAKLNAADGAVQWTTSITSAGGTGADIAVSSAGNVYIAGVNGLSQAYLAKVDPGTGGVQWTTTTSGGTAEALAVTTDAAGNVYLTGDYTGSVDFDPGNATHRLSSLSGSTDAFVWKLNSIGAYVWAGSLGSGNGADIGNDIAADASGNIVVAGYWNGTYASSDFDPGNGRTRLTNKGVNDAFVVKLAPNGNGSLKLSWAKDLGGSNNDQLSGIAVDGAGNVYLTGVFAGSADFDPGNGIYTLQTSSANDQDIFVSKLGANGSFVAAARIGSVGFVDGRSTIAVDGAGSIYTTGGFRMTADFEPTAGTYNLTAQDYSRLDVFIAKWTQGSFKAAARAVNIEDDAMAIDWSTAFIRPRHASALGLDSVLSSSE